MAASLLAALTQQSGPALRTRKGLVVLGLQNDFISPEGKLPVKADSGFLDRLVDLVSEFREFGTVFWIRSQYEADSPARDEGGSSLVIVRRRRPSGTREATSSDQEEEELFLLRSPQREPCCLPGTEGAEYAPQASRLIKENDVQIVQMHYSAFERTSLLSMLRIRLITDLYVCGCLTNIQVYATAMDAARYAINITLVEDCLGYRKRSRHEQALKKLREVIDAGAMSGHDVLEHCRNPPASSSESEESEDDDESEPEVQEIASRAPGEVPPEGTALEVDDEESDNDASITALPTYSRAFAIRSQSPKTIRSLLRSNSSKSSEQVPKRDADGSPGNRGKALGSNREQ